MFLNFVTPNFPRSKWNHDLVYFFLWNCWQTSLFRPIVMLLWWWISVCLQKWPSMKYMCLCEPINHRHCRFDAHLHRDVTWNLLDESRERNLCTRIWRATWARVHELMLVSRLRFSHITNQSESRLPRPEAGAPFILMTWPQPGIFFPTLSFLFTSPHFHMSTKLYWFCPLNSFHICLFPFLLPLIGILDWTIASWMLFPSN